MAKFDLSVREPVPAGCIWLLAAVTCCLSSCSGLPQRTSGDGPLQQIELVVADQGGPTRAGISCTLRNDKGRWLIAPPGPAEVSRSSQPLQIECLDRRGEFIGRTEIAATDQRMARAATQAKRGGAVGAALPLLFFGSLALSPGGLLCMVVTGVTFGGGAAAGQALADTATDRGFANPSPIELHF